MKNPIAFLISILLLVSGSRAEDHVQETPVHEHDTHSEEPAHAYLEEDIPDVAGVHKAHHDSHMPEEVAETQSGAEHPVDTHGHGSPSGKPSPEVVLDMLKAGNVRFYTGHPTYPHVGPERLRLAGTENQGDHAYATVISCSDSRVPVELIFDAGLMDIFVVRVAGNVCDTDEIGSIEYGLAHVHTPVLVVLGHTQCGAVTAVTHEVQGRGHELERNIPPLVDNIIPAVKRTMELHPHLYGDEVIPHAIEENVWQGMRDLFEESPAVLDIVLSGKAKVVGAIYDVGTGKVEWLPEEPVQAILSEHKDLSERKRRFQLLRNR
jgi:carbonic anhydrase